MLNTAIPRAVHLKPCTVISDFGSAYSQQSVLTCNSCSRTPPPLPQQPLQRVQLISFQYGPQSSVKPRLTDASNGAAPSAAANAACAEQASSKPYRRGRHPGERHRGAAAGSTGGGRGAAVGAVRHSPQRLGRAAGAGQGVDVRGKHRGLPESRLLDCTFVALQR